MGLTLKIIDTSWSLVIINRQQISIQEIIIAKLKIVDGANCTCLFKETFFIADIL